MSLGYLIKPLLFIALVVCFSPLVIKKLRCWLVDLHKMNIKKFHHALTM